MTPQFQELLFLIRQHPAYQELLEFVQPVTPKEYRPSDDPQKQWAEHIYRSGRRAGHHDWRHVLTELAPEAGLIPTSQKEQS